MEFLMQPINSRTLLQEVNENNITMSPLQYPVRTLPAVEVPTETASSADAQIVAAVAATKAGSGAEPQGSENSIEQIDPKTLGCTKRVRAGGCFTTRSTMS